MVRPAFAIRLHDTRRPAVLFLTHILKSQSSVCSNVDEEDSLACESIEVHSATTVQILCVVFVNGAICG